MARAVSTGGERPRALLILSGGGFTFETKCLLAGLERDMEFAYLVTQHGGTPGEGAIPAGRSWPVPSFASVTKRSVTRSLNAFWRTFLTTRQVLRTERIDAVVAIGCSHAAPMFLAARLARIRTVFLESITRTDRLSNTGKLVYHGRLADTFLVQWPRLQPGYPRSRVGTVL